MTPKTPSPADYLERLLRGGAALTAVSLLGCLGWLAATGSLTRYWADDYCYSYVMQAGGFLRGPIDWYLSSGNRFSTILLVGLQDAFGPGAIRWIPGLVLLAWTAAWIAFLTQLARLFQTRLSILWALPFALAQVFFAALLAPDRLQTLYWRMGTLHYTFPLVLLLLSLALAAVQLRRDGKSIGWAVGFFLLAFFAGGFSETYAAMQAGLYALLLACALIFARGGWKGLILRVFIPALLGAVAAMVLELLSPSNAWRQAALPPPSSLWQLIEYILRYTFDFTRDTLRGMPVPILVLVLLSACLAYTGYWRYRTTAPRMSSILLGALAGLVFGILLSSAAIAPSVYAGLEFPAGRALMPARFALLCGLASAAACLAALPRLVIAPTAGRVLLVTALTALVLLACAFYPLHALTSLEPERRQLAAWAVRWDARDAKIRALLAAQSPAPSQLLVQQVEVVQGLEDIGPDPLAWVNRCAAGYYGVHTIIANP